MRKKSIQSTVEYLSVTEAAEICGSNKATVLAWIAGQNLPAVRPCPGGKYLIPRRGLESWLAQRLRGDDSYLFQKGK